MFEKDGSIKLGKKMITFNYKSRSIFMEIIDQINFFKSIDFKIYPDGSLFDKYLYLMRIDKLAKEVVNEWSKFLHPFIEQIFNDIIQKTKKIIDISNITLAELIICDIETECLSIFNEFLDNNMNEVKIYEIMAELEDRSTYITGEKIERIINVYPYELHLVMGFVYSISFNINHEPEMSICSKSKIYKFEDLDFPVDVKEEIHNKIKELV